MWMGFRGGRGGLLDFFVVFFKNSVSSEKQGHACII